MHVLKRIFSVVLQTIYRNVVEWRCCIVCLDSSGLGCIGMRRKK